MDKRKYKREIIRGLILKFLAEEYPEGIDSVLLRKLLDDFGYPLGDDDLFSYVSYLAEKGFATISQREGFEIFMINCTATGLNLIDKYIDADPGIEVNL